MGFLWSQEFGRDGNFTDCFCVVSVEFLCSLEGVGTSPISLERRELHRLFFFENCTVCFCLISLDFF